MISNDIARLLLLLASLGIVKLSASLRLSSLCLDVYVLKEAQHTPNLLYQSYLAVKSEYYEIDGTIQILAA
jgi:hypothetical protein